MPKIERRVADEDEDGDGDEAEADDEAEPLSASWSSLPSVRVPREIVRATGMNERLPDVEVGRGGTAARKGYIFSPRYDAAAAGRSVSSPRRHRHLR